MRFWNLYVQISESQWGVFAGNQQARTSPVIPLVGQNHWFFSFQLALLPPPQKKTTHLRYKKHLNTLKTISKFHFVRFTCSHTQILELRLPMRNNFGFADCICRFLFETYPPTKMLTKNQNANPNQLVMCLVCQSTKKTQTQINLWFA